ncbi:hypothetical protein Ahy_A02g009785 isoform A [Arachis hypogaea]|uniref:Cyanobacterial aminoacyl-tRNA synthetase CAAD domain-containing protein n=1 Tax=Arachis hypogaea TaxID=3818 RepID=A0A445EIC0_ARAHY|nr:hypothetical protein Ahy_A02g009785 isoform A [Arachis hypogaea]
MAAAATTVLLHPRIPTTTNVARCSALPYLPPRLSTTSFTTTPFFSTSLKHFSGSQKPCLLQTRASSEESGSWDAVENKSTVLLYGGGAIVAVWLSSILVGAINSVPLLPKIMELVGLGYTGWFVYRYLLFKSSRKELAEDIDGLKKKITGTE